ncbi:sulfatase-like hydrolase/transferase [Catellatospora sp. NPDC049609]|uniref:sulfatase-like hydrolase/transferase n=1 Tax=Catellatospora sp. NPDC049609 TaxID=3155505 RepID=UPI003425CAAF
MPSEPIALADAAVPAGRVGEAGRARRVSVRAGTVLAFGLVIVLLVVPNELGRLSPAAFLRVPIDGLVALAVVLVLPPRARRVAVVVIGAVLGLLGVVKAVSLGFSAVLDRPFEPALDWPFLVAGADYVGQSYGDALMWAAVAGAIGLAVGVLALVTAAFRRVARLAVTRRAGAARTLTVLAAAWLALALAGTQLVPGVPVAAHDAYDQVDLLGRGTRDGQTFAEQLSTDAFRGMPAAEALAGLRGKDVIVAFVESYGKVALADPELSPQVGAVLDAGYDRLRGAGYAARSAWLTSPTTGGGSWLAQSTLLSGLWVTNQQRYRTLLASDRLTLPGLFAQAGWRTVAVMPATTTAWPEGAVYGYDQVYTAPDLGYAGPRYSFATMPDQYTLHTFQQRERPPGHLPVMAVIPLISSHSPWEPVPRLLGWDAVGDGSVYAAASGSDDPAEIVEQRDRSRVRQAYANAIAYSLETLISYVQTYGGDDLVLVFLGDHQPSPSVTGQLASRDAPVTILARDPAMLDRVAGWSWQDGLRPGSDAPVWRMDAFRDRFLTAFGPR